MSAHDDLAAAVDALGAEKTERESKVSAVRDALSALQSAVDALDGPADAPVADAAPEPEQGPPVDVSPQPAIDPVTGQPVVDNADTNSPPMDQATPATPAA